MPAFSSDDTSACNGSPHTHRRHLQQLQRQQQQQQQQQQHQHYRHHHGQHSHSLPASPPLAWRSSSPNCHSPPGSRSPPDQPAQHPIYPAQLPPSTAAAASSLALAPRLRRSLSGSQFSLIPEDRAVHITSVSRDGRTYKYRHESTASSESPASPPMSGASSTPTLPAFMLDRPRTLADDDAFFGGAGEPATRTWFPTNGRRSLSHALTSLLLWWPLFLFGVAERAFGSVFASVFVEHPYEQQQYAKKRRSSLAVRFARALVGVYASVALNAIKFGIGRLTSTAAERQRPKRTVLISGGRTLQALHLARNFQAAGFRVIAADIDDDDGADEDQSLPLCGFSNAVSRYYKLPRPQRRPPPAAASSTSTDRSISAYIGRLCDVVETEKPVLYVPVCAGTGSAAHFDALAKPHLVLRGCQTHSPGVQECLVLDDLAALLSQCERAGLAVPRHRVVRSVPDLLGLYDDAEWTAAALAGGQFVLHAMAVGGADGRDPQGFASLSRRDEDNDRMAALPRLRDQAEAFVAPLRISDRRPYLVVLEPAAAAAGALTTCTTIRESRVVANVTSQRQPDGHLRVCSAETNARVERWLGELLGRMRLLRPIDGHLSVRLVPTIEAGSAGSDGVLVPCGVRIGVPPTYVCHTAVQTRVLMPPCRHFSRQKSGPLSGVAGARYWMPTALVASVLRRPTVRTVGALVARRLWWLTGGGLTGGRDVLFAVADPLPWLVYCGWQLPRMAVRWWKQ